MQEAVIVNLNTLWYDSQVIHCVLLILPIVIFQGNKQHQTRVMSRKTSLGGRTPLDAHTKPLCPTNGGSLNASNHFKEKKQLLRWSVTTNKTSYSIYCQWHVFHSYTFCWCSKYRSIWMLVFRWHFWEHQVNSSLRQKAAASALRFVWRWGRSVWNQSRIKSNVCLGWQTMIRVWSRKNKTGWTHTL